LAIIGHEAPVSRRTSTLTSGWPRHEMFIGTIGRPPFRGGAWRLAGGADGSAFRLREDMVVVLVLTCLSTQVRPQRVDENDGVLEVAVGFLRVYAVIVVR
jgi:hypothetical protein